MRRVMMRKGWIAVALIVSAVFLSGCAGRTNVNSYLLPGGAVGGDAAKDLQAVKNIVVWPLENAAAGSKAKGVEVKFTDFMVDVFYLEDAFSSVYIMDDNSGKDLLARAGEELGLKKKPKLPTQSALVATKIGQLTGTQAILLGRIDDYDEVKVDKSTYTLISASFSLVDAREGAYAALDSFTPIKMLWRTNARRNAKETPFQGRQSLDEAAREMLADVATQLQRDISKSGEGERKRLAKKISALEKDAKKALAAGEFDKAEAAWNEVLEIDPGNEKAKGEIESIAAKKKEAAEAEKEAARLKAIDDHRMKADEFVKEDDLASALGEWQKVLQIDKDNEEAAAAAKELEEEIASRKAVEAEKDKSKNLHLAQQSLKEMKYNDAIAAAKKVLAIEPDNTMAKGIIEEAEGELESATAAEESVPPPVEAVPEAASEEEEEAPAPAASSDVEKLREKAMEHFNTEEYEEAKAAWQALLEKNPDDKQAKEMLETTEMLIEALK